MKDINAIYNRIVDKLKKSNEFEIIQELENSDSGAATGSEALMSTGYYLLTLKRINPSVYKTISIEIEDYLTYCKQNGLVVKLR